MKSNQLEASGGPMDKFVDTGAATETSRDASRNIITPRRGDNERIFFSE